MMQYFSPIEYLKIDIASNFGLDKENWDTRLDWFTNNEHQLDDLVQVAETPALFYAGVEAYRAALKGESIGYPISLDATASGAQLLAILVECEDSAKLCNVVDTGKREDYYTNIFHFMQKAVSDYSDQLDSKDQGIPQITRTDVKNAVMPALYGSKERPKKVFGEGALLNIFYAVMETYSPGVWKLNKSLIDLWQPTAEAHCWTLPDNFHVVIKTMDKRKEYPMFLNQAHEVITSVNQPMAKGISLGANIIHSVDGMVVREMQRRCMFNPDMVIELLEALTSGDIAAEPSKTRDKDRKALTLWEHYQRTGFLSTAILDCLDARNLGNFDLEVIGKLPTSLPEKPFNVLAIHDCFRVHPNYGNDLRKQYNQVLSDLAKSTLAADIASQILGVSVVLEKRSDLSERILEANYALS